MDTLRFVPKRYSITSKLISRIFIQADNEFNYKKDSLVVFEKGLAKQTIENLSLPRVLRVLLS